ncbi:MAG: DUF2142 domain-containing protein [Planctomycetes bacterium]|nr:DUF2142 domain-containing protein [Planctomycetota bacterium]
MHPPALTDRRLTRLVLVAALLHGLAYFFIVAPWMGEDEPWQFEYASHVADGHWPWGGRPYDPRAEVDERTLMSASQIQMRERVSGVDDGALERRQRAILASMAQHDYFRRVDWAGVCPDRSDFDQVEPFFTAAKQPPGYFAVLGLWMWPLSSASIDTQLTWARCSSFLLYLASVWIVLQLASVAFTDRSLALAAVLAFAWFPMNARQAGVINNDVLARTTAALVLMLCAKRLAGDDRLRTLIFAAVFAALSLLIKPTTTSVFVALGVTVFLSAKSIAGRLAIASSGLVLLAGAFYVWRTQQTTVLPRTVAAFFERIERGFSLETFTALGKGFLGGFNWLTRDLSTPTYLALAAFLALTMLSGFSALFHTRKGVSRPVLALCFSVVAFQLALVVLRGVGHGRYVMPALPALSLIVAVGFIGPFSEFRRPTALRVFATLLCLYDVVFLWGGLVPNEYLVWSS